MGRSGERRPVGLPTLFRGIVGLSGCLGCLNLFIGVSESDTVPHHHFVRPLAHQGSEGRQVGAEGGVMSAEARAMSQKNNW